MTTSAADSETISFPPSFAWGTSTSAYQVEGGWMEGRRGLSIWDSFAHTPGKIKTGQTGDVAADHFHRFRADVKLMAQMSLKYYRFSIAWARIMPGGTGAVNDEGVAFYSALIDELLKNGIHPVATLYHWDLPLPLQLEHDGWLSHHTANAFVAYARVCFERFGDRVKHWITINEPYTHVVHGFALGDHAPGRMMRPTTEPYIAGHYLLLAHAHAVAVYRQQYAPTQKGIVSIALNSDWREPLTASAADVAAAQRSMEFNLGWFADPIYFGDYPPAMRAQLGARLPTFSAEQRAMLTNSSDFFALQHYASMMISSRPENEALADGTFHKDENVKWHNTAGARKNMLGWDIAPFGLYKLAKWVHRRYSPAGGIVVTENGIPLDEEASEVARRDNHRVCYVKRYLQQLKRAMDEGVAVRRPPPRPLRPAAHCAHPPAAPTLLQVRGYFYWSFIDNFEWAEGTRARFGLVYIDYATQRRVAKTSAAFFARLAQTNSFTLTPSECNATTSVTSRFQAEAAELTKLMSELNGTSPSGPNGTPSNGSAGAGASGSAEGGGLVPTTMKQKVALATRTARCALLAEMQGRHNAEQGEFELMGFWLQKAQKFKAAAGRQKEQLQVMQRQQQQQRRKDEEERQAEERLAAAEARAAQADISDVDKQLQRDALLASLSVMETAAWPGAAADAAPEVQADAAAAWPATAPLGRLDVAVGGAGAEEAPVAGFASDVEPADPAVLLSAAAALIPTGMDDGATTAPPAAKKGWLHMGL